MRRLLTVSLVLAALATVLVAAPAQAHQQYTNGCSVPFSPSWRDTPGGFNFHDACDRHDLNYVNRPHGANEWGRSVADLIFWYDMRDVCRRYTGWRAADCYAWADRYYHSVRVGGMIPYHHWDKWVRANVKVYGVW